VNMSCKICNMSVGKFDPPPVSRPRPYRVANLSRPAGSARAEQESHCCRSGHHASHHAPSPHGARHFQCGVAVVVGVHGRPLASSAGTSFASACDARAAAAARAGAGARRPRELCPPPPCTPIPRQRRPGHALHARAHPRTPPKAHPPGLEQVVSRIEDVLRREPTEAASSTGRGPHHVRRSWLAPSRSRPGRGQERGRARAGPTATGHRGPSRAGRGRATRAAPPEQSRTAATRGTVSWSGP
jgi:hypothetical protein